MFYFNDSDITLTFQLTSGGTIIIADTIRINIVCGGIGSIPSGDPCIVSQGVPIWNGTSYEYTFRVEDSEILPAYYKKCAFTVTAIHNNNYYYGNGEFIVHLSDYDNMDTTEILLSNGDSVVIMPCAEMTNDECVATPPVKPKILSLELYKNRDDSCNCIEHK